MDYMIREIKKSEYPLLADFLYEAIFVPDGVEPPPKSVIVSPELQVYLEHFGELKIVDMDGLLLLFKNLTMR